MAKTPAVITISSDAGKSSASPSPTKKFGERLGNLENVTQAVLWVGLITLVAVVVAVTSMVIDQEHFNNETYREQTSNLQAQIQALQDEVNSLKNSQSGL